jgi:hypothetical protein
MLTFQRATAGSFPREMDGGGGAGGGIQNKIAENRYLLYSVLLYTDLDKRFMSFVRDHHDTLADISGEYIFIFWFEHFAKDSKFLWSRGGAPSDLRSEIPRKECLKIAKQLSIAGDRGGTPRRSRA